jgi:hypothetical protein
MASSPKPLPIHTRPFKPSCGKDGPKAAGRARNAVEFSCVRVMIALGGKREKGAVKEKSELKPLFFAEGEVVTVRDECEDRRERNVRNTAAMKNETAITTRGSRMMSMNSRTCRRRISSPAAACRRRLTSDITECKS